MKLFCLLMILGSILGNCPDESDPAIPPKTNGGYDLFIHITFRVCHDRCRKILRFIISRHECHKCCNEMNKEELFKCNPSTKVTSPKLKYFKNRDKIMGSNRPPYMAGIDNFHKIKV